MAPRHPLLFLPILAMLGTAPTLADTASGARAEVVGPLLTLTEAEHLPLAEANPAVLTHPRAAEVASQWPREVTLRASVFGAAPGDAERKVLLIGGIHGDEAVSYLVAELLRRQLFAEACAGQTDGLLQALVDTHTALYIVPLVNPYGTMAGLRTNFRQSTTDERFLDSIGTDWTTRPEWWDRRKGVDLNRNFPVNLDSGGESLRRPDGEGTHKWDAPGGCHQLELYYGGLLDWGETSPEPANAWLLSLIQQIHPDVTIALHQEARVMYVDSREPLATAGPKWAPFVEQMHESFNAVLTPAERRGGGSDIVFGIRADGTRIDAVDCVNDFSPGGYGAALSLFSGVVLTLEMTSDQTDAETNACWFPEGLLATYSDRLDLTTLRNTERLDLLLTRFRPALLQWILALDPECPEKLTFTDADAQQSARLFVPRAVLETVPAIPADGSCP